MHDPAALEQALLRIEELMRLGLAAGAEACCRELLAQAPGSGSAWFYLGTLLLQQGRLAEAESALRESARLEPEKAGPWNNLSVVLRRRGQAVEAEACARRAAALNPTNPNHWTSLASALAAQQRWEEALAACRTALAHDAADVRAWFLLGLWQQMLQRLPEAQAAYERCLELAPAHQAARHNLAFCLQRQWELPRAEDLIRELLAAEPNRPEGWSLLGVIRLGRGDAAGAACALRRSIALRPDSGAHSMLLHALQYVDDATPAGLLHEHRAWNAYLGPPPPPRPRPPGGERLRIGLVSNNLGLNPNAFLVLPALEQLDKRRCTLVCYADRLAEDAYTARFRAAADVWRVTAGLSHVALARQIASDRIDVLIDLMGHLGDRLPVFARRPAFCQVTWFGYVGTTGLATMDGLVADRFHVRPGEEPYYGERVLRLPHGYACYGPPEDAPPVAPLPALSGAPLTFGCFNNPAKYSPRTLDAWAQILRRVPESRLLLKYGGLHEPRLQAELRGQFARRGIAAERILLEGWSPQRELLAAYGRVDLALDTQPYSGGLTTCEALWMGVPVITFPGATFAGRHATSYLSNTGLTQFVAADWPSYVDLAALWASRRDELAVLRGTLRDRVRRSPLCDARQFADDLLTVLADAASTA